ncbi:MAG: hypothetical protein ACREPM_25160 [Gemmatimonadaceae bacterium]
MRRSTWGRALVGLWSLWLFVVLAEPAAVHSCPVHGAHGEHGMSGAAMAGMHGAHAAHGAEPASAPGDSRHGPAQCTCVGLCCCAPVAILTSHTAAFSNVPATSAVRRAPNVRAFTSQLAHAHPYANGPPSRSLTIG